MACYALDWHQASRLVTRDCVDYEVVTRYTCWMA